ncbi:unnamed protein product [Lampetra planeri]
MASIFDGRGSARCTGVAGTTADRPSSPQCFVHTGFVGTTRGTATAFTRAFQGDGSLRACEVSGNDREPRLVGHRRLHEWALRKLTASDCSLLRTAKRGAAASSCGQVTRHAAFQGGVKFPAWGENWSQGFLEELQSE